MSSNQASLGTRVTAALCAALLIPSNVVSSALPHPQAATTTTSSAAKIPNDQLDSLVAPIALYPDPLLAQVLAASTYPLEIIQLQQWMTKHPDLKGEALAAAVEKENWDPAVQGLAGAARRRQTPGRRHQVDDRPRQCLPRAAERRDGRRAAHAKEGLRCGEPEDHRAAEGHDAGCPDQGSHRDPASQSAGDLRPGLQPRRRLRPSDLSLSADLLPARGLLRCGCRDRVRRGRRDGRVLGRRLGLRPAMGLRQRQHQREQPVCEPLQPLQQLQPVRRQLESQSAASRRRAVRGSQHREPLWRHGAGRFTATRQATARQNPGASARTQPATGANRSGSAGANRAGASPAHEQRGREPRHGERGQRRPRRQSQHPEQPGFLQPKRQRLRRRRRAAARAAAPPAAAASAGRPAWARRAHAPAAAAGDGGNRP